MAPPAFADLGEAANDVFEKGYNLGFFKVDAKTKTQNEVEFEASISSNRENGKVSGSLQSKYTWTEYGLTFTETWNTDNVLTAEIKSEDKIAEGLDLALEVSVTPQTGESGCTVKGAYKTDMIHLNGDIDLGTPVLHGAAVFGYEGFLAGYQLSFDASKSEVTQSDLAFGYATDDFSFTTMVNNAWKDLSDEGQEFSGSVYHKVNDKLEAAVNLAWSATNGGPTFAIGGRYKLDDNASLSAKVNNQSHIGLCYAQTLRDDLANGRLKVGLAISSSIDCKNINQGGHKLGIGLDFEA